MPKSRNRGGKKQHLKRVKNRNKKIQDKKNAYSKYEKQMYDNMLKQYEKQMMSASQSQSTTKSDNKIDGIDGPEL